MKNNELLKNKDKNNLLMIATEYNNETKIFNTDVFNKNKKVKYKEGYYKPIGYLPKDDNNFCVLTNIITDTLRTEKIDYEDFYDECKKKGCKTTDLFLCIEHKNKEMTGKIIIPASNRFFEVDSNKLNFEFR